MEAFMRLTTFYSVSPSKLRRE